jgi:hypothetical protein
MAMTEDDAAKLAIVRQFQAVGVDYQASLDRQKQFNEALALEAEIQTGIQARANDCYAAARVLNFDLIAALAVYQTTLQHSAAPELAEPVTLQPAPQTVIAPPGKAIWEIVLDMAKAAHPKPIRASAAKAEIERQLGRELHFKTVGMSLYRLSRQGFMRRVGQKDWYFVPPEQRAKNSGGSAPEQEWLEV